MFHYPTICAYDHVAGQEHDHNEDNTDHEHEQSTNVASYMVTFTHIFGAIDFDANGQID
jgi:hypothetical protein